MRKAVKSFVIALSIILALIFSLILYYNYSLPNRYYISKGDKLTLSKDYISASAVSSSATVSSHLNNQTVSLNLFNVFPIKTVSVKVNEEIYLLPSGNAFGIKMFTDGAVVVGFSEIKSTDGNFYCPGIDAGIKDGDIITSVNGEEITRNEQVALIIEASGGNPLEIEIKRDNQTFKTTLYPVLSEIDNTYKGGIWVRDSAAGIGTMTYIDPKTGVFAGLGHPILDVDTGVIMPIESGDVCEVVISNICKGNPGVPGELQGIFASGEPIGNITLNNQTGIYGTLFTCPASEADYVPLGYKQEAHTGSATILCDLGGDGCKEYDIEIQSIDYNDLTQTKNMVIKVTDEKLLALTGGIVQGMSGTPILQDGKLIGAVTHVFVNNPAKGYAIFAENMYCYSNQIG